MDYGMENIFNDWFCLKLVTFVCFKSKLNCGSKFWKQGINSLCCEKVLTTLIRSIFLPHLKLKLWWESVTKCAVIYKWLTIMEFWILVTFSGCYVTFFHLCLITETEESKENCHNFKNLCFQYVFCFRMCTRMNADPNNWTLFFLISSIYSVIQDQRNYDKRRTNFLEKLVKKGRKRRSKIKQWRSCCG